MVVAAMSRAPEEWQPQRARAYDHRCAISNLPDDHLLDAAHIMADAHELLGQPVIANGIALSKIHQSATGASVTCFLCAPAVPRAA